MIKAKDGIGFAFYTEIQSCRFDVSNRLWIFESGVKKDQPCTYQSIVDALWWGVVTLSTTGYGDVIPQSVPARIVAAVAMVCGIILFSTSVSLVSSALSSLHEEEMTKYFLRGMKQKQERQDLDVTSKFMKFLKLGAMIEHKRSWNKGQGNEILNEEIEVEVGIVEDTVSNFDLGSTRKIDSQPSLATLKSGYFQHNRKSVEKERRDSFVTHQREPETYENSDLLIHNLNNESSSMEDLSIVLRNYSKYLTHMTNVHKKMNDELNILRMGLEDLSLVANQLLLKERERERKIRK
ncbi:hypothetical protein HK096_000255 [Nowakowskiella sp. JEL0078]|nr:hypothetical protein HK096_000255 [Nowakowskiella sp. JEL0078]